MKNLLTACALYLAGSPAFAGQPDLSDLVTDTIGYITVQPGVLMLEGESMGTFICQFNIEDKEFQAYAKTGELEKIDDRVVCIPIWEFEK